MNHRAPLFCQRWRERRSSYRPAGEVINPRDFDVQPIPESDAKTFVRQHHYSRQFVVSRFNYGLFTRALTNDHWTANGLTPELAGVASFSVPQHPAVVTNVFPGNPNDSIELGRFVLLDHVASNAETFFLKRCRELLKKKGLRGVVAFSDNVPRYSPDGKTTLFPGHIGTIYVSDNWRFVGKGAKKTLFIFPDGTSLQPRTISKIRNRESGYQYACSILVDHGADKPGTDPKAWLDYWLPKLTTRLRHPGCLKFALPISNTVQIAVPALPHPKNFASEEEMLKLKQKAATKFTRLNTTKDNGPSVAVNRISKGPDGPLPPERPSQTMTLISELLDQIRRANITIDITNDSRGVSPGGTIILDLVRRHQAFATLLIRTMHTAPHLVDDIESYKITEITIDSAEVINLRQHKTAAEVWNAIETLIRERHERAKRFLPPRNFNSTHRNNHTAHRTFPRRYKQKYRRFPDRFYQTA